MLRAEHLPTAATLGHRIPWHMKFLLELTCRARSPEGKSHQMTCENVMTLELFFGWDGSQICDQMSHLVPLFELFCLSISIFGVPKWSWRTHGRTNTRTHTIFFLPLHNKPFGQKCAIELLEHWLRDLRSKLAKEKADLEKNYSIYFPAWSCLQELEDTFTNLFGLTIYYSFRCAAG